MKVTTKKHAMAILTDSLFNPVNGRTLRISVFCTGKYKNTPTEMAKTGMEVIDIEGVHAVYGERRQDSEGPYTKLYSVGE